MGDHEKIKVRSLTVAKKTSLPALGLGLLVAGMVCVGLSFVTEVQAQSMVTQVGGHMPADAVILANISRSKDYYMIELDDGDSVKDSDNEDVPKEE